MLSSIFFNERQYCAIGWRWLNSHMFIRSIFYSNIVKKKSLPSRIRQLVWCLIALYCQCARPACWMVDIKCQLKIPLIMCKACWLVVLWICKASWLVALWMCKACWLVALLIWKVLWHFNYIWHFYSLNINNNVPDV